MKKVILVSIDWRRPQDGKTSQGIASIAAALTIAGVQVTVIDETVNAPDFCKKSVLSRVQRAVAGDDCIVGFGVYI